MSFANESMTKYARSSSSSSAIEQTSLEKELDKVVNNIQGSLSQTEKGRNILSLNAGQDQIHIAEHKPFIEALYHKDSIVIIADFRGADFHDINISYKKDVIIIFCDKKIKKIRMILLKKKINFSRKVVSYRNGFLEITLPIKKR